MNGGDRAAVLAVLDQARGVRELHHRRARRSAIVLSAAVPVIWVVAVMATNNGGRVIGNVEAAITMVFGSFVAGSTPQGGGAVAFPVLTKLLGVSPSDARTFSLCIQAVGMGTASLVIWRTRKPIDQGALKLTIPAAVAGFLVGAALFAVFPPPAAYVKVAFTLLVAITGLAAWLSRRSPFVEVLSACPPLTQVRRLLCAAAFLGGAASSLVGSGADVGVYLVLSVLVGVRPAIGVSTSVVTMAAVSVVGLVTYGLIGGAFLHIADPASGTDMLGLWIAAVPVVAIGAPAGNWVASRVSTRALVRFICFLAAAELVITAVFLDELRSDLALLGFAIFGLAAALVGAALLSTQHNALARRRRVGPRRLLRGDLEVSLERLVS